MVQINHKLWIKPKKISQQPLRPSRFLISVELDKTHVLLINGLTGAIDIVSREEFLRLSRLEKYRPSPGDDAFTARGHLIGEEEEKLIFRQLCERVRKKVAAEPLSVYLCPTNTCPMGCAYCIEGSRPNRQERALMDSKMTAAIFSGVTRIEKYFQRKAGPFYLFGGEPLQPFSREAVASILAGIADSGNKILIFSNGLFMKDYLDLLRKFEDFISGISITLDGMKEFHENSRNVPGSFGSAISAIEAVLQCTNIRVVIRSNIARANIGQIPELKSLYNEKGWWNSPRLEFELAPVTNHGLLHGNELEPHAVLAGHFLELLKKDPDLMRFDYYGLFSYLFGLARDLKLIADPRYVQRNEAPRIFGCQANYGGVVTFCADGTVHLCVEEAGEKGTIIGRFFPELRLDLEAIGKWTRRTVADNRKCNDCAHAFYCGGGCTRTAVLDRGDFLLPDCGTLREDITEFIGRHAEEILTTWRLS